MKHNEYYELKEQLNQKLGRRVTILDPKITMRENNDDAYTLTMSSNGLHNGNIRQLLQLCDDKNYFLYIVGNLIMIE